MSSTPQELDGHERSRTKRLRGYRFDDPEPPEVDVREDGNILIDAPDATMAPTVHRETRGPRIVVETLLDELEPKIHVRKFDYNIDEDEWPPSDDFYNKGVLTNLANGTGQSDRLGTKIIARRLVVRGHIRNADAEVVQGYYRVVVLRDTQRANPLMDANSIVFDGPHIDSHFLPWNVGSDKRFQVLADQVFNPQEWGAGVHFIPFVVDVRLDDEVCTFINSDVGWAPQYYVIATYDDDTVHLTIPTVNYSCAVYFVDP